ncbi:hypothetical protein A9F12_25200 [Klebsiella pneumoniae]|nr:hypothetical protein A9F12_25200 [Klebsiella pneumoniae]
MAASHRRLARVDRFGGRGVHRRGLLLRFARPGLSLTRFAGGNCLAVVRFGAGWITIGCAASRCLSRTRARAALIAS